MPHGHKVSMAVNDNREVNNLDFSAFNFSVGSL